jgi:GIY-YIG catalytic domain-containing protein
MPAPAPVTVLPRPDDWRPESDLEDGERCEGVYLLLQNSKVVYVGQTSHLLLRLTQHRAEGKKRFSHALYYHMPGSLESDRLWVEGALICLYRPPENKAWNIGMSSGKCWEIGFGRRKRKK